MFSKITFGAALITATDASDIHIPFKSSKEKLCYTDPAYITS